MACRSPINKKPNIAIIVDSISPGGGVSNVALAQAKALSNFFCISMLSTEGDVNHPSIQLHRIKRPKLFWLRRLGHSVRALLLGMRFTGALKKLDHKLNFDFVIFHSHLHAHTARKRLRANLPMGLIIHGDIYTRPKSSYDPLLTKLYEFSSRKAYTSLDLVVALSPYMKERAISYGAHAPKTIAIPNGLDNKEVPRKRPFHNNRKPFRLLFAGRLSMEKDPITLLKALTQTSDDISLALAGSGPLQSQIERFIQQHSLSNRVELLGHIGSSEMQYLYQNSDALCVPSISDPLPTVVLEAMRAGLPVIGTNVEGIPYMIKDAETGLIVPSKNPKRLSDAIMRLYNSADLCVQFSKTGRARFLEKFSVNATSEALAEAITKTIKNKEVG